MDKASRIAVRVSGTDEVAAVREGSLLYTSGISSPGGTVEEEVGRIYSILTETLHGANASWSDVVKLNYYTTPLASPSEVRNKIQDAHLEHAGRSTCAVLSVPLLQTDDDSRVIVEVIARPDTQRSAIEEVAGVPGSDHWVHAVRSNETLYISGQLPLPQSVEFNDDESVHIQGDLAEQTAAVYGHHHRILKAGGMQWSDAVQVHQFITERKLAIEDFQRARHRYLTPGHYLSTSVACETEFPQWPVHDCLILADLEADNRRRTAVQASGTWGNAPGPHAFWCGNLLRMHGQVPRDLTAKTQYPEDIDAQTRLTFENLTGVLHAADISWGDVIHVRTFCRERDHLARVRHIRREWLDSSVASTDLVADFFDPLLLVEVELVAVGGR